MLRLKKGYPKSIKITGFIECPQNNPSVSFTSVEIPNDDQAYRSQPILFDHVSKTVLALVEDKFEDREVYKILAHASDQAWNVHYSNNERSLKEFLRKIYDGVFNQLIIYIHAIRKIQEDKRLIDDLVRLRDGRNPERAMFRQVENFVKSLIFHGWDQDMQLLFPPESATGRGPIEIAVGGLWTLPLSHYGAGIEQLLTFAAEIVRHGPNKVVLIEEPEAHFHPDLQRKFIRFLRSNRDVFQHQYLIASHSSVLINELLDMKENVFYVHLEEDKDTKRTYSQVEPLDAQNTLGLLEDLGARPSDLLQANGVIWVEGPSDRIYIRRWIQLYCDKYETRLGGYKPKEGSDYQVLCYGGSLLKYIELGENEPPTTEGQTDDLEAMINLLRVNRNSVFVMDRDDYDHPNDADGRAKAAYKKRFLDTCQQLGILTWMTKGTKIENYLPDTVGIWQDGKLTNKYKENKVRESLRIAKALDVASLAVLDLEDRIGEIVTKIREWNT